MGDEYNAAFYQPRHDDIDDVPFGGPDDDKPKGKSKKPPFKGRFFQMPHVVYDSEPYHLLGLASQAVIMYLLRLYDGSNNGRIGASSRSVASACRINRETAMKAFHELQDKGFIVCQKASAFADGTRLAPEWRLSFLDCNVTGKPASNSFLHANALKKAA